MLLPALGYAVLAALAACLAVVLVTLLRRSVRLRARASETEVRLAALGDQVERASVALRQAALDANPPSAAPSVSTPPADEPAAPRRRRRPRPAPARP